MPTLSLRRSAIAATVAALVSAAPAAVADVLVENLSQPTRATTMLGDTSST